MAVYLHMEQQSTQQTLQGGDFARRAQEHQQGLQTQYRRVSHPHVNELRPVATMLAPDSNVEFQRPHQRLLKQLGEPGVEPLVVVALLQRLTRRLHPATREQIAQRLLCVDTLRPRHRFVLFSRVPRPGHTGNGETVVFLSIRSRRRASLSGHCVVDLYNHLHHERPHGALSELEPTQFAAQARHPQESAA